MKNDAKGLRLYTTPTCPHCKRAKLFLDQNGIRFREFDVLEDMDARKEMIARSGQMGVPVLVNGDDLVIGFDLEAISNMLGLKK